jgi:chromosomal replication initiator protein
MIRVAQIQRAVADHYGLPLEVMKEPDWIGSRAKARVHPRQQAMTMASILTVHSYVAIGRLFGGRDHSTVIHALRKTQERLTDPKVSSAMRQVAHRLLLEEAGQ